MNKDNDYKWNNLPIDLLIEIAKRLDFPGKIKFSAVSKSWQSATFISEVSLSKAPYLLLAEATGTVPTVEDDEDDDSSGDDDDEEDDNNSDDDDDDDSSSDDEEEEDDDNSNDDDDSSGDDDEEEENDDDSSNDEENDVDVDGDEDIHNYEVIDHGDHEVVNDVSDQDLYNVDKLDGQVTNTRDMFCLSTAKTYNIELPQASGKLILGTNKGWLLTLGRDSKINLLHPFSKKQISLPPMLTFTTQLPEGLFHRFIVKVAMSSTIPTSDDDNRTPPIVMAIYEECNILGFVRLGDKLWTDVNVDSRCFEDIAFHKNKFYAINNKAVFMCEIDDDDDKRGSRGTKIASLPLEGRVDARWYLVESSSRHDLLLIARIRKGDPYRSIYTRKYYTSKFLLWKLEYSEGDELGNWIPVTNLDDESLFIGKTSSFFVSSSEIIKRNCIYFTDDSEFFSILKDGAGGHDMGIYSIEHRTIESHFTGTSTHPFSPPLWYI